MAADFFTWNGRSSLDFGLRVERYPPAALPARKQEKISVPGRSGDLLIVQDAFENTNAAYDLYFNATRRRGTVEHTRAVAAWLLSPTGYLRLEDSYDPARYRLAALSGPLEIQNNLNRYGRCTVTFDCKAQCYSKSGAQSVSFSVPGALQNPEQFAAFPLITVYGSGSGVLSVGGTVVKLLALSEFVTLDSETQNAYKRTLNKNSTISAPVFPRLLPGGNEISFSGGIDRVEIVPRWWTL